MSSLLTWAKTRRGKAAIGATATLLTLSISTAAFGLPWDLDMVDSHTVKAYEKRMLGLPEGVVSQENLLSPKPFRPTFPHMSAAADALHPPFPADEAVLTKGEKYYGIYCTPCHGDGVVLGPVAKKGVPVPVLFGTNGVIHQKRPNNVDMTDGYLYYTIRHGSISTIMPAYGYTMTDDEMWSIVHYLRVEDGKVIAKEPKQEPSPTEGAAPTETPPPADHAAPVEGSAAPAEEKVQ